MLQQQQSFKPQSALMTAETLFPDDRTQQLVWTIANAADDRKAVDILALKVKEVSYLADYFILASGFSRTQVRAIADSIEKQVEENYQRLPVRVEGKSEGNWIVLDYGEIIVHLMLPTEREFYNLEAFWGHAECLELSFSS